MVVETGRPVGRLLPRVQGRIKAMEGPSEDRGGPAGAASGERLNDGCWTSVWHCKSAISRRRM